MADGVTVAHGANSSLPEGTIIATDDAGADGHVQLFKMAYSANGSATLVPVDADGMLVNLGANNDVTVTSGTVTVTGVATQTTLAAILLALGAPLQAGGTVALDAPTLAALETITVALDAASLAALESITATGPLTDAQLRATAVPVSGTVAVTGSATAANQSTLIGHLDGVETVLGTIDADTGSIAASASTLAGAVAGTEVQVDVLTMPTVAVTGPLTDAALRATAVPVSGTFWQATQPVSSATLPLPAGASTVAEQQTQTTAAGGLTETAPATDTASSGLNGRLQRIAQRLTSLIALLPTALGAGGGLKVDGSGTALPVSGTVTATVGTVTAVTTVGTITNPVAVTDNAGSLTVDAPVDTPAFVRLSDGTSAIATLPVSLATAPSTPVTNVGTFATQSTLQAGTAGIGKLTANAGVTIGAVEIATAQTLATVTTVGAVTALTNALPAGTNAIGKLAANSGVDIGDVDVLSVAPPPSFSTGQVAPTTSAGTVVIARPTRRIVNIANRGAVTVFLGPATVTTANGYSLLAGEAKDFVTGALIQGITASGTGSLHVADEY